MSAFGEIEGVEYPVDSGAGEPGVFWYPTSADPSTMTRSLSRKGHWDRIEAVRENYETITGQKVLNVLFDGETAAGVSFVGANSTTAEGAQTVKAKKEIIIAAGTIHTPQILQRSGVGAKSLLEAAKVEVVVDLPGVGHNFQDHPLGAGATFGCRCCQLLNRTFSDILYSHQIQRAPRPVRPPDQPDFYQRRSSRVRC